MYLLSGLLKLGDQLVRCMAPALLDAARVLGVGIGVTEDRRIDGPPGDDLAQQLLEELVVALTDVRQDVFHRPAFESAGPLPSVGRQRASEREHLRLVIS